jgi:hypothetical protein
MLHRYAKITDSRIKKQIKAVEGKRQYDQQGDTIVHIMMFYLKRQQLPQQTNQIDDFCRFSADSKAGCLSN